MLFVNKFERLSVFLKHMKFFAPLNFSFFAVSNTIVVDKTVPLNKNYLNVYVRGQLLIQDWDREIQEFMMARANSFSTLKNVYLQLRVWIIVSNKKKVFLPLVCLMSHSLLVFLVQVFNYLIIFVVVINVCVFFILLFFFYTPSPQV